METPKIPPKKSPEEFLTWWDGYLEAFKVMDKDLITISIKEIETQLNALRQWTLEQKESNSNNHLTYRITSPGMKL